MYITLFKFRKSRNVSRQDELAIKESFFGPKWSERLSSGRSSNYWIHLCVKLAVVDENLE